jgi:hypothetical protein
MKKVEKDEVFYGFVNFPYSSRGRHPVEGGDKGEGWARFRRLLPVVIGS